MFGVIKDEVLLTVSDNEICFGKNQKYSIASPSISVVLLPSKYTVSPSKT